MTDPRAVQDYLQYCDNLGVAQLPRRGNSTGATTPPRALARSQSDASALNQDKPRAAAQRDPAAVSAQLQSIRAEIGDCTRCKLCEGRTNIVFGVGNPIADLMFVGEAPGADEDAQGEPFVGRAGQLLNKIIAAMGLRREQVYIGNINKCRPPNNRAPLPDEVAACVPFLLQQIAAIQPKVIVCLGSTAVRNLFDDQDIKITKARGIFREWNGVQVMPTYHPAFLLRNPNMKKPVWDDMQKVMAYLGLPIPTAAA